MSSQVLLASSQNDKIHKIVRPTTNYHPSVWGEQFFHYNTLEQNLESKLQQIQKLKEVVRKEIFIESAHEIHQLNLIDALERLGLSYHFECEIEKMLECIYENSIDENYNNEDLHDASIRFRILRQHGFNVPSNIFEKFTEENGNFKESLATDILGVLSLYEASHLSYVGENILDEALAFTTTHLQLVANEKEHPLSHKISLALERPLRKSLERLYARHYISIYENDPSHSKTLLELAKLDFNLLQCIDRKELSEIVRWWTELDFRHKLPFARDRIVEVYLWICGVYFEPKYSLARNFTTKVLALASAADDIYDAYGTIEELELLTQAIERWDINFIDKLIPEYLQAYYKALLNCYDEIAKALEKDDRYKVHYAKEAMKRLIRAYFEEARWLNQGHIPSFDEHLSVSLISSGYPMLIANSFVGIKDIVSNEVFEWLSKDPKIVRNSTIIARFMDDIVSHKVEQERDHVMSTVECYMNQYGVSEQAAVDELNRQVVNAWKEINEEFIRPTAVPSSILVRVLNFSRVIDLLYKDDDGYTRVGKVTKDSVAALLIDSVPL